MDLNMQGMMKYIFFSEHYIIQQLTALTSFFGKSISAVDTAKQRYVLITVMFIVSENTPDSNWYQRFLNFQCPRSSLMIFLETL